jgi:Lon protease-like protein
MNQGSRSTYTLPMFPLGGPLMPGALLPLQIFEPRYLEMIDRCLVSRVPEFGVVMIERGSEVGGGDVRSMIGVTARIVDVKTIVEGRLAVLAVGERRFEVVRWLEDDPHPIADVRDWPEADEEDLGDNTMLRIGAVEALERVLALTAELGVSVPDLPRLDELDEVEVSHAVVTLAPLGASDRQRLLRASGPRQRLRLFAEAISEVEDSLRFRLLNPGPDR